MRKQVGTVTINRVRIYQLDPRIPSHLAPQEVVVEPGEYPLYEGSYGERYWKMTGLLDGIFMVRGDGTFTSAGGDAASDDEVVFYSRRYGPDEWTELLKGYLADPNPALSFDLLGTESTEA